MCAVKWLLLLCVSQNLVLTHATPLIESQGVNQYVDVGKLPVPSTYDAPRFRWWWPGGWVEPEVVKDELQSIALAGFGGGEIGDVEDSIKVSMNPKTYGWARPRWNAGVVAAYEMAKK